MRVCCDSQGHVAICADSNFEMEYLYNLRGSLHGDVDIHREAGFVGARTLRISPTSEQEDSPANSGGVAGGQGTANSAMQQGAKATLPPDNAVCEHCLRSTEDECFGCQHGSKFLAATSA